MFVVLCSTFKWVNLCILDTHYLRVRTLMPGWVMSVWLNGSDFFNLSWCKGQRTDYLLIKILILPLRKSRDIGSAYSAEKERKRQRDRESQCVCCIQITNQTIKTYLHKLDCLRQTFPWCQKMMKPHTSTHQKSACQWWVYIQSHSGTPPSRQCKKSQMNFFVSTPNHAEEFREDWYTRHLNNTTEFGGKKNTIMHNNGNMVW